MSENTNQPKAYLFECFACDGRWKTAGRKMSFCPDCGEPMEDGEFFEMK